MAGPFNGRDFPTTTQTARAVEAAEVRNTFSLVFRSLGRGEGGVGEKKRVR